MFTPDQIEWLKRYFAPKPMEVVQLPEAATVTEFTLAVLKYRGVKYLYIMVDGKWNLIKDLTE